MCRASTSYLSLQGAKDVDGRVKPGHDGEMFSSARNEASVLTHSTQRNFLSAQSTSSLNPVLGCHNLRLRAFCFRIGFLPKQKRTRHKTIGATGRRKEGAMH